MAFEEIKENVEDIQNEAKAYIENNSTINFSSKYLGLKLEHRTAANTLFTG